MCLHRGIEVAGPVDETCACLHVEVQVDGLVDVIEPLLLGLLWEIDHGHVGKFVVIPMSAL